MVRCEQRSGRELSRNCGEVDRKANHQNRRPNRPPVPIGGRVDCHVARCGESRAASHTTVSVPLVAGDIACTTSPPRPPSPAPWFPSRQHHPAPGQLRENIPEVPYGPNRGGPAPGPGRKAWERPGRRCAPCQPAPGLLSALSAYAPTPHHPPGPSLLQRAGARNHPGTGEGLDRRRPTNRPPTFPCAPLIGPGTPSARSGTARAC